MRFAASSRALLVAAAAALASASARPQDPAPAKPQDPVAAEIARWSTFLASVPAASGEGGAIWDDARKTAGPVLARADQALRDGRRLLAIQRLAAAREVAGAARYVVSREAPVRSELVRFEAEWRAVGERLGKELEAPAPGALSSLAPAALRAIGEASLPQVKVYYEASLEYGRATVFDSGLYYIGSALAQRELPGLLASFSDGAEPLSAPPLRSLEPELEALESQILAAYRPPASIDRHVDFIRASSAVKEARELDALGLRYGALLRYLQGLQRFAPVRTATGAQSASSADGVAAGPAPDTAAFERRLAEYDERLRSAARDHTIGRLFLETAQALAGPGEGSDPALARAIVDTVLPRYFAALEPAPAAAPRQAARATVTLVRWPYT
jgi:hypothetical protein